MNLNPTTRRYTWHSRGKSSRLDYLLISEHLLNEIHSFDIRPGLHSDHSILKITLGNNDLCKRKNDFGNSTSLYCIMPIISNKLKILLKIVKMNTQH